MPRNYTPHKRGKTLNYSKEQLEKALDATKCGMSVRKAAQTYSIPKSTLADRVSGRFGMDVVHGRPTAIPLEVEKQIVNCVKVASQRGIGLSRKQLLQRANILSSRIKVHSSYQNFQAGKNWWEGLKKRHNLTLRQPERLGTTRCRMMNMEVVGRYFNSLGDIISKLNLGNKPENIWNCDETGKNFEHNPVKVVTPKGAKNVCGRTTSKSTNITIMACVNAAGAAMPPMFVVKGKTPRSLYSFNTTAAPPGTVWSFQDNGWMTDQLGEQWFDGVFLKHCGPMRPQLLILDGHSSHESLAILQRAIEENIYILALPPHTTHHLQPLDKSVFGPFNKAYNAACSEFLQDPMHVINKWNFPALITKAWQSSLTFTNIQSGFAACGIYPFNCNAVPSEAFTPSTLSEKPLSDDTCSQGPSDEIAVTAVSESQCAQSVPTFVETETLIAVPFTPSTLSENPLNYDTGIQGPSDEIAVSESQSTQSLPQTFDETEALIDVPFQDVIMDPSVVLELIQSGDFVVDGELEIQLPHTDDHIPDLTPAQSVSSNSPSCPSQTPLLSNEVSPPYALSADWNEDVKSIFLPPSTMLPSTKPKRKHVTSHRLLTSEDVIREKMAQESKKMQKLNKPKKNAKKRLCTK